MRGWEFARRLVLDGHCVTVICGGSGSETIERSGLRIVRVAASYENSMSNFRRMVAFLRFVWGSAVKGARIPADVVFASSTPLTVAIPALIAAKLQRCDFVFEVRDLWPSVPVRLGYLTRPSIISLAQSLERLAYRSARSIIALSRGMAEGVLQTCPSGDVHIIPNAADIDLFNAAARNRSELMDDNLGESRPTVVYAGSMGEIYNIQWLVRLAAAAPGVRFILVGEGKTRVAAKHLAVELGLSAEVLLPGKLSREEVARLLVAADLVISSVVDDQALYAASINKVFDGMAAGKPILFNHGGWLTDLCTASGAGWRLPDDIGSAAQRIEELVLDRDCLAMAANESRQLATHFARDELYAQFSSVLLDGLPSREASC